MAELKAHKRINDILLGPIERPALQWLAAHTPAWVTPDLLTAIGFVGSLVIFAGYALTFFHPGFLWLASLGFVINWFGDSLDGTLARYRNKQRPKFGFFIDHTTDALSQMLVFLGLGLSPYVQFEIAAMGLTTYLLMSILAYVSTIVTGIFQISYSRVGATEMRVLAILLNILVYFFGRPLLEAPFGSLTIFDIMVSLVVAYFLVYYVVTIIRRGTVLSRADLGQSEAKNIAANGKVPAKSPAVVKKVKTNT